jgi:hypothetical protein
MQKYQDMGRLAKCTSNPMNANSYQKKNGENEKGEPRKPSQERHTFNMAKANLADFA